MSGENAQTYGLLLHYDSAPSHTVLTVLQFLTENNMAAVSYHFFRRKRPL
jgi:hypothetical protein